VEKAPPWRETSAVAVDVASSIVVDRPRGEVAAYAMDPSHVTSWYKNITSVDLSTAGPLAVGSTMAFEARFLGRTLAYTYEVIALEQGRRLVMRTADGPFPMETTYLFEDSDNGGTAMTLRNWGEPTAFSRLVAPLVAPAMRRANRADLKRLKAILEGN
jgi:hypothetical protein